MRKISELLDGFRRLVSSEKEIRQKVALAITETIKIHIKSEQVRVSGKTAFIDCSGAVKSEIRLKEKEILSLVKETIKKRIINSIR